MSSPIKMNNKFKSRVLQVFTTLDRGGAETMIMNYYRNIDRSKMQFDFLVHREEKGAYEDEILSLGGQIYRMPKINLFAPHEYYKALDLFLIEHPYYKVIHSHINTFSSFPLKVAMKHNIPCRISHAHIAMENFNPSKLVSSKNNIIEELKKLIKIGLRKNVEKYSTDMFSCGEKAGNWLFRNNSFEIVNNAINTSDFIYDENVKLEYIKKLNLQGSLIIGHVGRFNEQKNHTFILDIFKSTLDIKSNSYLVLVGDGDLRKSIEKKAEQLKIKNNIIFMGVRKDIPNLLQMFDVFLFPSLYEGLPVTLIEAQASGLKVFASDRITREVSITDDIEFLSIDDSPEYWAKKIISSVPYERKNNYETIKEAGYDIKENAEKLQNFYLEQYNRVENR